MATPSLLRRKSVVGVLAGLLGLGTVGTLLLRNAGNLFHSSAPAEGSLRVNINTATLTELENIPGIGPKSLESLRPYVKAAGEAEKLR